MSRNRLQILFLLLVVLFIGGVAIFSIAHAIAWLSILVVPYGAYKGWMFGNTSDKVQSREEKEHEIR
jgi:hypothetical protein